MCRHASYLFARTNVPRHDGSCSNDGIAPDRDAFQNNCTSTDPDAAPDPDSTAYQRLFAYRANWINPMVMIRNVAEWAN
jgi:hypothetical protein